MEAFFIAFLWWVVKLAIASLVVWLVIWLVNSFLPFPPNIKYVISVVLWALVGIFAIILLIPIIASIDGLAFLPVATVMLA